MVGLRLFELIAPTHQEAVRERWLMRRAGKPVPNAYETRVRGRDGVEFDAELRLSAMPIDGRMHMLGIVRDITEEKATTAAREFTVAKLEALLDNMTEGLLVVDPDAQTVDFNKAGLLIHGMEAGSPSRMSLPELRSHLQISTLEGTRLAMADWPVSRALRGETFTSDEYELCRLDTGHCWTGSYGGARVLGPDGKVLFALVTVRDIPA